MTAMLYDDTHKLFLDEFQVGCFAKAQIRGDETGLTKDDWMQAIQARADQLYEGSGLSKEQRFSKCMGGSAYHLRGYTHNTGDTLGRLYHEAYKHAPPASRPKPEAPVDVAKATAARAGSANEKMLELARSRRQAFPSLSSEQAFNEVWNSRDNIDLKNQAVRENWDAVNSGVGNTAFRNSPAGQAVGRASAYQRPNAKSMDNQEPRPGFDMIADPTPGSVAVSPGRA